jgi:hypothetical protein
MPTREELDARRTCGNDNVLCDIGYSGCPFVKINGTTSGFCLLYRKSLVYVETGNNDLCTRCLECKSDILKGL